jgi:hypothetical protein
MGSKKMKSLLALVLLAPFPTVAAPPAEANEVITVPFVDAAQLRTNGNDYQPNPNTADRVHYSISKNQRGNSIPIRQEHIVSLCGDIDGCSVRIGMHNWDDTGRVASRQFLFYYNPRSKVWRASRDDYDTAGTDSNNVTEHVNNSWSCYMTDGVYANWQERSDPSEGFGLLSWNQYNADCWLTIID